METISLVKVNPETRKTGFDTQQEKKIQRITIDKQSGTDEAFLLPMDKSSNQTVHP
ncbi:MAG: hypothetical protein IJ719_13075 [Clostridia bacterium]|nr:hypothetical protein [Clostridia bacterium]